MQKIGFDISCKLSPKETICMKYQSLFSEKEEEKYQYINLPSAEFAQRMVKVLADDILNYLFWKSELEFMWIGDNWHVM